MRSSPSIYMDENSQILNKKNPYSSFVLELKTLEIEHTTVIVIRSSQYELFIINLFDNVRF